jgi:hypothetical protein
LFQEYRLALALSIQLNDSHFLSFPVLDDID